MELDAALEALARILNEERRRPTSDYRDNLRDIKESTGGHPLVNLAAALSKFPRADRIRDPKKIVFHQVWEKPEIYTFGGTNYDLLQRLFAQLTPDIREQCFTKLLEYARRGGETTETSISHYPKFGWEVSDTPLIAEFMIRLGRMEPLLAAVGSASVPTSGLVLLLMQVSELVILNFTVLSEAELKLVPKLLAPLRETADLQTYASRGPRGGTMVRNPKYKPGREVEANAIVKCIDAIAAECDQALFFYLKGALRQTRNPEIEGDKIKLVEFLYTLGFPATLNEGLEEAERQYRDDSTQFELKSCLGHLRSFLEFLHRETAKSIAANAGDTVADRWGEATNYLRRKSVFTQQHEAFAATLYTLISDTSVHPLGADREYARLLRNMVIEYGVMFLSVLDKNGVKIT